MPQLDVSTFIPQLFWLVICFSGLYIGLKVIYVPKVQSLLDSRWTRIEGTTERAREDIKKAEALLQNDQQALTKERKRIEHKVSEALRVSAQEVHSVKEAEKQAAAERLKREDKKIAQEAQNLQAEADSLSQNLRQILAVHYVPRIQD